MLALPMVEPDAQSPQVAPLRLIWEVSALVHAMGDALDARFAVCAVKGDISGFQRAASGHCYFSLKDGAGRAALIRCAMFRRAASLLDFVPADGQTVVARGRVSVYEPRGELQFIVESLQPSGAGALFEQFLRLKAKLEAEGLFETARKRALPRYPRRIGVVTSLGAAALHDVASALARRAPQVELVVYPSLVQGADAPAALSEAIALANRRAEVDLLIVCRGGGALEDLWAFNDELVVRAIVASRLRSRSV
jgi:exodeoxyribonuclease VII large subunit